MSNALMLAPASEALIDARSDDPAREIRIAAVVGGTFFIGLLGWAALAPLDAAAYAYGQVKVSGERQLVQIADGGMASAVHIREGQRVRAGQLLVEFATTQALGQERALASRVIGLQAQVARLTAEAAGARGFAEPAGYAILQGRDRQEADRAMTVARAEFAAWQSTSSSQTKLIGERIAQVGNQLDGYAARQSSNADQRELNRKESDAVTGLVEKGYATQTRLLALQRSAADLEGQRGAQEAEMARLRNEGNESRMQLLSTRAQAAQQVSSELRQAQTDLQSLLPQWKAAQDVLARSQLRAPVDGAVTGLSIRTAGEVATPGQKIAEIVPLDKSLQVEAQVAPGDVNDIVVGQEARIRVNGLHGRNVPLLKGQITRISADSFSDEKTGRPYYTTTVRVAPAELRRAADAAGITGSIRPGTPVSLEVRLRKRSALQYLTEPLAQSLTGSLHER